MRHFSRPPQVYQLFRTMSTTGIKAGPVETAIQNKLLEGLMGEKSIHLEIVNESYKHNVAKDSESHFNVLVVTDAFEGIDQNCRSMLQHIVGTPTIHCDAFCEERLIHGLSFRVIVPYSIYFKPRSSDPSLFFSGFSSQ